MIKISVIIPVYNRQDLISNTINSILKQSLREIEIICVDDGSTDGSLNILKSESKKDKRVLIFHQENAGAGSARNLGIIQAKGEYLFFLDSDDSLVHDSALEKLYNKAKEKKVDVCGGRLLYLKDDGVHIAEQTNLMKDGFISFDKYQHDYFFTRFIYSRKCIIENSLFFPNLCDYEDPVFFVNVMKSTHGFYYTNLDIYLYNKRGQERHISEYSETALYDRITGITYILKFSSQEKLDILHLEQYNRLVFGICPWIKKNVTKTSDKIIYALILANANIDIGLLKQHIDIDEYYIVSPLRQIISLSNKYDSISNRRLVKLIRSVKGMVRKRK